MPVNTSVSSSTVKVRPRMRTPGMLRTIAALSREGNLDGQALKSYLTSRVLIAFIAVAGMLVFGYVGLWAPVRKALFSWREGLEFDGSGIILHVTFCLFLIAAFLVGAFRLYRRESRLLRLFNYGEVTTQFTFSADRREYTYTDHSGGTHTRHFAQDHAGLSFGNSTLNSGVEAPQRIWSPPDAEKCAESITGQTQGVYVLYLPERPDIFHMVVGKGMDSYRLRKGA